METTTTNHSETTKTTNGKKAHTHSNGVYAVVTLPGSNTVDIVFARTRIDLTKALANHGKELKLHGVFKGRQLEIKEKVSFNFN